MKKLYLLFFVLALQLVSRSQTIEWTKTFSYGNLIDEIKGLTVDSAQNIYMSGNYMKTNYPNPDIRGSFLNKLDSAGNILWADTVDEVNVSTNIIALTESNVFTIDRTLTKRDLNGDTIWRKNIQGQGMTYLNNALYIGNNTTVYKYDLNGNIQGSFPVTASDDLCNSQNYLYMQSGSNYIHKYDTLGNQIWSRATGMYIFNMTTDENDNTYLIDWGGMAKKIDSSGTVMWTITSDSLAWNNAQVINDTVYICGSTGGQWSDIDNTSVRRSSISLYSAQTGLLLNEYLIDVLPGFVEQADFIFKSGNDIYLAGSGGYQMSTLYLAKINRNNITAGLHEIESNSSFAIYPNPTKEIFQISYYSTNETKLQFNVFGLKGETICSENISQFEGEYKRTLDLSDKAKGIYFVEIIADKKRITKKIVLD